MGKKDKTLEDVYNEITKLREEMTTKIAKLEREIKDQRKWMELKVNTIRDVTSVTPLSNETRTRKTLSLL